jgi:hypothetical protein
VPQFAGVGDHLRTGGAGWNDGSVAIEKNYDVWAADAEKLHALAQELLPQTPTVEIRISRTFADDALAAWQREEEPGDLPQETDEQRIVRGEATTLALIGQSIEDSGIEDGDHVVFKLDAWVLGNALEAADRAGRLETIPPAN